MKAVFASIVASVLLLAGCEPSKPGLTVYVTVPDTQSTAVEPIRTKPAELAKPTEPAKQTDPWEEARAFFKKAKEVEPELTEKKLDKLDFQTALVCRQFMKFPIDIHADNGKTAGQYLLANGFDEFVTAASQRFVGDTHFRKIMDEFNPNPTRDEIIRGVIQFAVTNSVIRDANLKLFQNTGDRRTTKELNHLVSLWTGK